MSQFDRDENRGKSLKDYQPLVALYAVALLVSSALCIYDGFLMQKFMHFFMGFLLVSLSLFKLFDLQGFANGFHMYDLLAKRIGVYGFIYPFIELGLGLLYLSFLYQELTYLATIIIMLFGSLGIILALKNKLDIYCPCMGSILKVPLSTVSLVENLLMMVMASLLIIV